MKKVKLIYVLLACCLFIAGIQACKQEFLDRKPMGALNETVLANKTGVEGLLIGTYHMLGGSQNWGSAPSNWVRAASLLAYGEVLTHFWGNFSDAGGARYSWNEGAQTAGVTRDITDR